MGIWDSFRRFSAVKGGERRQDSRKKSRKERGQPSRLSQPRHLNVERFEDRVLLAINPLGPKLVAVIPNAGDILEENRVDVLNVAPSELLFRFSEGQNIDPSADNLSKIQVTRAGNDGSLGTADDVPVAIGYVGVGDFTNEVMVRFASTLPDDVYRITIDSTFRNQADPAIEAGETQTRDFELDLGAQVVAVVPQPVSRVGGVLQQARDKIEVYFNNDDLDANSVTNPAFYHLIATNETADTSDDPVAVNPTSVTYDPVADKAVLTFAADLDSLFPITGAMRLRVGNEYAPIQTSVLNPEFQSFGPLANGGLTEVTAVAGSAISDGDMFSISDGKNTVVFEFENTEVSNGLTDPNHVRVPFTPADLEVTVARSVASAINYAGAFEGLYASAAVTTTTTGGGIVTLSAGEAGNSFYTAQNVGDFGATSQGQSVIITGQIAPSDWDQKYAQEWPGAVDEPGHRDLPPQPAVLIEDHYMSGGSAPDGAAGVSWVPYGFPETVGSYKNLITDAQKDCARAIFGLYSNYLGVNFYESEAGGIQVLTGDLAMLGMRSGPGGVAGLGGGGIALMDWADFQDSADSEFGGSWFNVAMHEIGHVLGYGHSYDLPSGTIMGSSEDIETQPGGAEPVFPGDNDIVHGQHMYRPDSMDVDLYRFQVQQRGVFSAEILAERRDNTSQLDSELTLYQEYQESENGVQVTKYRVVARNDDFYSEDSFAKLYLREGSYYLSITSTQNSDADPNIDNSGMNGVTQGPYDLRMSFTPGGVDPNDPETFVGVGTEHIVDAQRKVFLDGDADGVPGGVYDFFFNVQDEAHTLFVDKLASATGANGTLAKPYKTISAAFTAAQPGTIVRIVGNNFDNDGRWRELTVPAGAKITDGQTFSITDATQTVMFEFDGSATPAVTAGNVRVAFKSTDSAETVAASIATAIATARTTRGFTVATSVAGDVVTLGDTAINFDRRNSAFTTTLQDNVPYEIGYSSLNTALSDGKKMEVPRGVTVMIDAGALLKFRKANIDVGTSTEGAANDRSSGALQVLGIPGRPVYLTSHYDETFGVDTESLITTVAKEGDWGGLVFRNNFDYDYIEDYDPASGQAPRKVLEQQGIFLNYVNHALLRSGGGEVVVNSVPGVYAPIHMIAARPTATYNTILKSADSAISGDPNSFADTRFQSWDYASPFTVDYERVGPEVHGNQVLDNTVNGMYVRIRTEAGRPIDELEVPGRFDDWDIVHVIPENLIISGTAGGGYQRLPTVVNLRRSASNEIRAAAGAQITDAEYFSISDGTTKVTFEFDLGETNGYTKGRVQIFYARNYTAEQVAQAIADAINNSQQKLFQDLGLTIDLNVTAVAEGDAVRLVSLGTTLIIDGVSKIESRLDSRLMIDPGVVVKVKNSRIEAEFGAQLIAEGRPGSVDGAPASKVVFTSLYDDRYGSGGTFDTTRDGNAVLATPGQWGGIYFNPTAEGSLDYAVVAYGGGTTTIEGGFASFNPLEIRQAHVRVANSRFENNTIGGAGGTRNGRAPIAAGTISVRGAQPVIVNNDFINNAGPAITIDVNAMKSQVVTDWGRSTGEIAAFTAYSNNVGPLVRENRMSNNGINGMEVRAATLTTEVVWDDTDIVHVLRGEIIVPNYHHYGGIRLQSSDTQSLVVKLLGDDAGFSAMGRPLEIDDRIGGTIQVLGMPGHPVVLTSLNDDSVGAGFDLRNRPQFDTNNDGQSVGQPGDWRSVKLEAYSNDRNVAVVNETERPSSVTDDANDDPESEAQELGYLAPSEKSGDDVQRLGFEVHGHIRLDDPSDVDVYTFKARPGTEIWIDLDRTSYALDAIVELIDAEGNVLARSDNSVDELEDPSLLEGLALSMNRDAWLRHDFYTVNPRDPGMRLVLPGSGTDYRNYYVRVRSSLGIGNIAASAALIKDGDTFVINDGRQTLTFEFDTDGSVSSGRVAVDATAPDSLGSAIVTAVLWAHENLGFDVTARLYNGNVMLDGAKVEFGPGNTPLARLAHTGGNYQMQVRLREMQEIPGSTVQYADILYATNGVEVLGLPNHSPLTAETSENSSADNGTRLTSQEIGNLLGSDRSTLGVAGYLTGSQDVDWYRFEVDYEGIQSIGGVNDSGDVWSTVFDIDYADDLARPDLTLWVFDSAGRLILVNQASNVVDDQPDPTKAENLDDLSRGSAGTGDPYIGTAYLLEKQTYYVAVTSTVATNTTLGQPLTRLEPIDSVSRVVEEHIDSGASSGIPVSQDRLTFTADAFQLGDVVMYVNTEDDLYTVDPFSGAFETDVTDYYNNWLPNTHSSQWVDYNDIAMRNDGQLYTITGRAGVADVYTGTGNYRQLSTEDAKVLLHNQDDGVQTYEIDPGQDNPSLRLVPANDSARAGVDYEALAHDPNNQTRQVYAVGNIGGLNLRSRLGLTPVGLGTSIDYVTKNLIYALNSNGQAVTHPDSSGGARLVSDIVPLGELVTSLTIFGEAATDTGPQYVDQWSPYNSANPSAADRLPDDDILDGMAFNLVDDQGQKVTFEYDCGPDVRLDPRGARMVRDGDTFRLSNGDKTVVFEFDSGRVLKVQEADAFADHDRFVIYYPDQNGNTTARVFEYDLPDDPKVFDGSVAIAIAPGMTIAEVQLRTVQAINTALGNSGVLATFNPYDSALDNDNPYDLTVSDWGRISISGTGERGIEILQGDGLQFYGDYGTSDPNHVAIPFEETWTEQTLAGVNDPLQLSGVKWIVQQELPGVQVGYAHRTGTLGDTTYGDRFTFLNAADNFSFTAAAAYATLLNANANNNLRIEGIDTGTALNGVQVRVVGTDGAVTPIVSYDDVARVITIQFDADLVTVQQVAAAVNAATDAASFPFRAVPDAVDLGTWGTEIMETQTVNLASGVQGVRAFTYIAGSRSGIHAGDGADEQIAFRASDDGVTIAEGIVAAIEKARRDLSFTATAVTNGDQVALGNMAINDPQRGFNAITNPDSANLIDALHDSRPTEYILPVNDAGRGPLLASGAGPGGTITGLTYLGNQAYAVDDLGGLYRVTNLANVNLGNRASWGFAPVDPQNGVPQVKGIQYLENQGPKAQYISTLTYNGQQIRFSGLTAGPQNVEDGRYANMLFATDTSGHLYAINTQGELQPVFLDGATRTQLQTLAGGSLTGVQGVTFSPIDYNLWHQTDYRGTNAGHGVNTTFDHSRINSIAGGTSWYFGLEDPDAGTTIANQQPGADNFQDNSTAYQNVYQTYNLPGGAHGSLTTGTFSLKGYTAGDQPTLYFTYFAETQDSNNYDSLRVYASIDGADWNLLATNTDRDSRYIGGVDIVDTGDSWRQARIGLGGVAGQTNIRLRFDFSTASDMEVGVNGKGGTYLAAVPGAKIADGDTFTIDSAANVFEFDMGYALMVPNAAGRTIANGEWFEVAAGGAPVRFTFSRTAGGANTILISDDLSAEQVAVRIVNAIAGSGLGIVTFRDANHQDPYETRIVLQNATYADLSPGLRQLETDTGRIILQGDGPGVAADHIPVPVRGNMTDREVAEAIYTAVNQHFSGVEVQALAGVDLGDTNTFRVSDGTNELIFELDDDGTIDPTSDVGVTFTRTDTAAHVAQTVASAINNSALGTTLVATVQDSVIRIRHRTTALSAVASFTPDTSGLKVTNNSETAIKWDAQANGTGGLGYFLHLIGHSVPVDAAQVPLSGPLGYSGNADGLVGVLPGDAPADKIANNVYGPPNNNRFNLIGRGQNNQHEGWYIDDIIIGFAERGEMATGVSGAFNDFTFATPGPTTVIVGDYEMEIRRGPDYGTYDSSVPVLALDQAFDTNDRLAQSFTLQVPAASQISHGLTFTLSDGVDSKSFIFLDETLHGGGGAAIPIYYSAGMTDAQVARAVTDVLNTQKAIKVTATTNDTSNRVDLFGATRVEGIDYIVSGAIDTADFIDVDFPQGTVRVTDTVDSVESDAGNRLRDAIVGPGIDVIGDAVYTGGRASSGFWTDGVNSGILLTTGDAENAEGPNNSDSSTGTASGVGDSQLDTEYGFDPASGLRTMDTSSLEFQFHSQGGDLYFEFVFASEEYNEYVNSGFNDVFAFFLDGENIALIPETNERVSINTINGGNPLGTDPSHPELYYNNDPSDNGGYRSLFGYDGFTRILVAQKTGLSEGIHSIRMVISDVSDTALDSGVFIKSGSFSDKKTSVERTYRVTTKTPELGDQNHFRDQGQVILNGNRIMYSEEYGVVVAPYRDSDSSSPHPQSPRTLGTRNSAGLVPSVTIQNNVLAFGGSGGISFSGETGQPSGAVPFGRIINNSIYGLNDATAQDVGILVADNASPTLLNNIVANSYVGLSIDGTSGSTVVGATVYQGNATHVMRNGAASGNLGNAAALLGASDPLFVDPSVANFYLAQDSDAIDSAISRMEDRPELERVKTDVGIPLSPIIGPAADLYGQERKDDIGTNNSGTGEIAFMDRGAIERVDLLGPDSQLIEPLDNDPDGVDRNRDLNDVRVAGVNLLEFAIQLSDAGGTGIADNTVTTDRVQLYQDDNLLVEHVDYLFEYDSTNDVIYLFPTTGLWTLNSSYKIVLDNQVGPGDDLAIRDIANNPLQQNRDDGTVYFTIAVAGLDFGDAPDTGVAPDVYPTMLASDGARHVIAGSYLGATPPSSEPDALQNADATGDNGDDGVVFETPLLVGGTTYVNVTASGPGFLNGWIDFTGAGNTRDGVWDNTPSSLEHVFVDVQWTEAGTQRLAIATPAGITGRDTFARFRFSTVAGLGPQGEAPDGEVEDYKVSMIEYFEDFGDLPNQDTSSNPWFPTTLAEDGPRHRLPIDPVDGLYLGKVADADSNGQPNLSASGDDINGVLDANNAVIDDEDGLVTFLNPLVPGKTVQMQVEVTIPAGMSRAYLQGWLDFNGDYNWVDDLNQTDPGEQIITDFVITNPNPAQVYNTVVTVPFTVPADAVKAQTYMRLRLSSAQDLSFVGTASDGEVEDYSVSIISAPEDYGDAPAPYPTLRADDGARHTIVDNFYLGAGVDFENNGQPSNDGLGDDSHGVPDDEDGISFSELKTGTTATVTVVATIPDGDIGYLNGWIDFDGNGEWDNTAGSVEHVVSNEALAGDGTAHTYTVSIAVPRNLTSRDSFARFRLSHVTDLTPNTPAADELAPDGEVEDDRVTIIAGDSTISGYKFNDLNADGVWQTSALAQSLPVPAISLLSAGSGTRVIAASDNGWSSIQDLGFNFEFYGVSYDQFYVNNNGSISFGWPVTSGTPQDFPSSGAAMIAPFWADADTQNGGGSVNLQRGTSVRGNPFVQIDWVSVGYAEMHTDLSNSFTLYVEDDPGGDIVAFFYDTMQWASGDLSGGTDGFGGTAAQIGFNAGDGENGFSALRPSTPADLSQLITGRRVQPKFAYRFDPTDGEPVGKEPGLANWEIYLDLNNNGTYEPALDEPMKLTDQNGYYQFTDLFPGDYVVREVPKSSGANPDWIQTLPGSAAGYAQTITLGTKEDRTDVNFGNYQMAKVSVTDVAIAEGNNNSQTQVRVTLEVTDSFGAPITINYSTQDGSAKAGSDYTGVSNGTFTFTPQATPANVWTTVSPSGKASSQYDYQVSGNYVVWEGNDGSDWEIYLYDGTNTRQLTDNTVDDRFADVFGTNVVWSQWDGTDYEVMYGVYDPNSSTTPLAQTTQLTHNAYDDTRAQVSASSVAWLANLNGGEVFQRSLANLANDDTLNKNLSNNSLADYEPQISGDYVVWAGSDGVDQEIYLYDGAETRQLSNNNRLDQHPAIDGNMIVWEGFDGTDYEIYYYQIGVSTSPKSIMPATDTVNDTQPAVSGNNIVWMRTTGDADTSEIWWFNPAIHTTGTTDAVNRLTRNAVLDEAPRICGNQLVWHSRVNASPANYDVYYMKLDTTSSTLPIPMNLSATNGYEWYPQVSDECVVWRSYDGSAYQVTVARPSEPKAKATVTLVINGDDNFELDEDFFVNFSGPSLAYLVDAQGQIQSQLQSKVDILNDDGTLDYGDASTSYPVLLSQNGARHQIVQGMYLGSRVDTEGNGQPSAQATGDDTLLFDDEDGVSFPSVLSAGANGQVTVVASMAGKLDAWMDWNQDGDWSDADEKLVFSNYTGVKAGSNDLAFAIPADAKTGTTFARFRYSSAGVANPTGTAADGEVEDYQVTLVKGSATVVLENRVVTVTGTDLNDVFNFTGGNTLTVTVNGSRYEFAASAVDRVVFDGKGGQNEARITGTSADEEATLSPNSATFNGPGIVVTASNAQKITVDGGGSGKDAVYLYDSTGDDTLTARPGNVVLTGPGYTSTALNCCYVYAFGKAGGSDVAYLYDSAGNDAFRAEQSYQRLTDNQTYSHRVAAFESVQAFGSDGNDAAVMTGSNGTDKFVCKPESGESYGQLTGPGYSFRVKNFDSVAARDPGGTDIAQMYDSDGDNLFVVTPAAASMTGSGMNYVASGFEQVTGYGTGGDAGGKDTARIFGSGRDDTFAGYAKRSKLTSGPFTFSAANFDYVLAYAGKGGTDVADLYDSTGADTCVARPDEGYVKLYGNGFYNLVSRFGEVRVHASGNAGDVASLFDTAGDDVLTAAGNEAKINKVDMSYVYTVDHFQKVTAKSSKGTNTKQISAIDYVLDDSLWK
jgi:hypothetical protein